jgi:2,3-bisphosphoglycerate-independent phosphoglycerate mutase
MSKKKVALIIMDGWGLGQVKNADAIQAANTPFVNSLYTKYPNTTLVTCGEDVGLPEGQMGNSEVGHLNLGAGRIVYQELQRINVAIKTGELAQNPAMQAALNYAITNNKPLHLMGLVSNGGVHAHINHLKAIIDICKTAGLQQVFIHAFTDGRDTDPKSGLAFLTDLQNHLNNSIGVIASITGRYYAMDRDKRWERVALAYNALVHGHGKQLSNPISGVEESYANGITDEFIQPIINSTVNGKINEGDAVLCFNFRTDRCREITEVLTQADFTDFGMRKLNLHYTTITQYNAAYKNIQVIFNNDDLKNTLGEVLANHNKTQVRIAETEKYPHVSFFFSGGREKEFEGEKRLIVASPKVATYDLQPQMSANEVANTIVTEINENTPDFICLNFANADMVGHTGDFNAVITAVETVDQCVQQVVTAGLAKNYTILLTADHGNADFMINQDGTPNTAHTTNLVPLFLIDSQTNVNLRPGKLGDIAPTILHIFGINPPTEMTGINLIN